VEAPEALLVEHLRDEPHVSQRRQPTIVGHCDSRGLLAAMLQREQAEVGQPGDVALERPDPEETAHG
jgi:hypothetical protein